MTDTTDKSVIRRIQRVIWCDRRSGPLAHTRGSWHSLIRLWRGYSHSVQHSDSMNECYCAFHMFWYRFCLFCAPEKQYLSKQWLVIQLLWVIICWWTCNVHCIVLQKPTRIDGSMCLVLVLLPLYTQLMTNRNISVKSCSRTVIYNKSTQIRQYTKSSDISKGIC